MALSNATRLSDFATGIGTAGSALKIDNTNQRVGLGTTNPQTMVQVGQGITMDGSNVTMTGDLKVGATSGVTSCILNTSGIQASGIITAISGFAGDAGANLTGVVTATSFEGDGSNLTGVSGFGTALNSTQGTLGNLIYKTPRNFTISGGSSIYVNSDASSGFTAFSRLGEIHVGSASTLHIGSGTTFVMDVLKVF